VLQIELKKKELTRYIWVCERANQKFKNKKDEVKIEKNS